MDKHQSEIFQDMGLRMLGKKTEPDYFEDAEKLVDKIKNEPEWMPVPTEGLRDTACINCARKNQLDTAWAILKQINQILLVTGGYKSGDNIYIRFEAKNKEWQQFKDGVKGLG